MSGYKPKLNPFTGQLQLVNDEGLLYFKASVSTVANLPATGNTKNDARIVNDTQHMYVWDGSTWIDQGDIFDIEWSAINGKPSSNPSDIDDAVSKRHSNTLDHTQNTDKYLTTQITKILYVDANRTDIYIEDGAITKPFKTITNALIAASSGTAIILSAGTYNESIVLKAGISIIGIERDKVNITSALNTITHVAGACVLKDLTVSTTGSGKKAINVDSIGSGWLKLQNVFSSSTSDSYPLYCKDSINIWGRYFETEGGQIYIENCSNINIDKMQFYGKDPITALYIKDCSADNAVIIRDGAILGISVVGGGNKAAIVENSKVLFSESRIQSALDDGLTISDGLGSSNVIIDGVEIVINNLTKKSIKVEVSSILNIGNVTYDNTKVTFTGTVNFRIPSSRLNNDSTVTGTTIKDALNTLGGASHTQNSDTKLAEGTGNEVTAANAKDAVDKKHDHANKSFLDGLDDNLKYQTITITINNGDNDIPTGIVGDWEVPFNCNVVAWTLLAAQSGSIVMDVWKDTYTNYPPTDADAMPGGGNEPTISATIKGQVTDVSGWTTKLISAGDILRFNVDSCSGIKKITLSLKVKKV